MGRKNKVIYHGCEDIQANWGMCSDPRGLLTIGNEYTVMRIDSHDWYTKYYLKEMPLFGFNSVCFDYLKEVDHNETA